MKKTGKLMLGLYHQKRAGVNQAELVMVYISVVRPVVEYSCRVRYTHLPNWFSDNIELIPKRVLKAICVK